MTFHRALMVTAAVLMLASAADSQGNRSPEARLRAAMDKETVEGDLKAAIDGYKQVISQRDASRTVVAQALLRLGMAYEKQGDAEARKSYERLVREFGDQPEVVQQARARMVDAVPASNTPRSRQVCTGDVCGRGVMSPDGRLLLDFGDALKSTAMAVHDLVTGESNRLASDSTPLLGRVCCVAFSADGKRIAYALTRSGSGGSTREVVVTNVDGTDSRVVYRDGTPESWSPDGRRLLVSPLGAPRLVWVTLANGTTQNVPVSDGWENLDVVRVSPDGRFIAFSGNRARGEQENLYLMATAGGETRVSPGPSYQEPVGWSPDSKYLVYWQLGPDVRAGQVVRGRTLWAVRVANGAVHGPPVKVRQFDDQTIVLGLSPTGSLYYRVSANAGDLYTASMDLATGKVTTVPAVLPTPNPGGPAAWSPDSRRIALMTGANPQKELHVFSLEDGKDQRIPTSVPFVNGLCWPSSDSILTNTMTAPGGVVPSGAQATRIDAVRVDVATGDTRPAFPGAASFRLWACTDTTAASNDPIAVKVRNLSTGAETELYRLKRTAADHGMSKISPDGRLVAFLESLDPDTSALMAIPSTGGPARELARAKAPAKLQAINGHAWSHDSRFVYFLKRVDGKGPYDLYRVPATGGREERMGLQAPELRALEIAPDGRTVFFAMGTYNRPEIWAMENFLPTEK